MVQKCEEKTETRGVVITYIDCSIYIYIKTRDSHESNEYGVMNIAIAISSAANPDRHLLQPRPQKKKNIQHEQQPLYQTPRYCCTMYCLCYIPMHCSCFIHIHSSVSKLLALGLKYPRCASTLHVFTA